MSPENDAEQSRYRAAFENSRDALLLLDRDGYFDCNERAVELFDVESTEACLTYAPWDLAPPTQPDGTDSREAALAHIDRAFETGSAFFEWVHRRPDGATFPTEVKLSRVGHGEHPTVHALVRDISDRRAYQRQITEQRDNLGILNQVLRHDIRNDLQLIVAYAELVAEQSGSDGTREYVDVILNNARHAVELTTTARQTSRVLLSEEDAVTRVNLAASLDSAVGEVRDAYQDAVVTLATPVPPTMVRANEMLDAVFRNLLKNAVQHNDKDRPEVVVSVRETPQAAVVRIADNGPGIPDGQKRTVFGKGETGLDSSGTGLGLYLVETLVDTYDGTITVEDNDPVGSVFTVTVPAAN